MQYGKQAMASTWGRARSRVTFAFLIAVLAHITFAALAAAPNITATSDIASREGGKALFTVSMSGPTPSGAYVKLTLVPGTAAAASDFSNNIEYSSNGGVSYSSVSSGGVASIAAGVTSFLVKVSLLADSIAEGNETYNLVIDPVASMGTVQGYGIGTILNVAPAAAPPNITAVSDISANEGQKATFTVSLSGPTASGTSVRLRLTSATALSGADFSNTIEYSSNDGATYSSVASGGTVTLAAGVSSFLVRTLLLSDATPEPDETYSLSIDPITGLGTVHGFGLGAIVNAGAPVGSIPNPQTIAGKPVVGRIVATSGQIIENVHVTTSDAGEPCIAVIGVSNVIIRNSEIGPCGSTASASSVGIAISGASNITVAGNVIHDVASGAYIQESRHPIIFEKNYVHNIRGPLPRGQMIQANGLSGGSGVSRINCNVSDAQPGVRYGVDHSVHRNVEDHINFFHSGGLSSSSRIEIAYNRLRGGNAEPNRDSGSGIVVGDGLMNNANIWAHDNIVTNVRNVGMAIANGQNITFESNRIYMDASVIQTRLGLYAHNYHPEASACTGAFTNNRVWASNGAPVAIDSSEGICNIVEVGNNYFDTSLTAEMFDTVPPACQ